jgi:hypothetical protein
MDTGIVAGSTDVQRLPELYRILVNVVGPGWTSPGIARSGVRDIVFNVD